MSDYSELQKTIDKVIGKIGLTRTTFLLETFIDNTSITHKEGEKIKMVAHYVSSLAIKVFELDEDIFYVNTSREYRDARMCCYHLLRKYTSNTFTKIGLFFHCGSRVVARAYETAEGRLSMVRSNKAFNSKYTLIESRLLDFMGHIK